MIPIPTVPDGMFDDCANTSAEDSPRSTNNNPHHQAALHKADACSARLPRLVSRPVADETSIPLWHTSLHQAVRELLTQSIGRLAGAAAYTGLSHLKGAANPATVIGAMSAGVCAGQLLQHQIGTASTAQKAGVGLASVSAIVAGGVITGYASIPTACIIASGSLVAAIASSAARSAYGPENDTDTEDAAEIRAKENRCPDENITLGLKILGFAAGSAPFLIGFLLKPSFWLDHDAQVGTRNLSVVIEALAVELAKATVSTVGISVNKDAMVFEEKFKTAMMGFLPYVISSVLLNGVAGGLLQAELRSDQFTKLVIPALVGALANCVKGAANAAAARYVSDPDATFLQANNQTTLPHQGTQWPIRAQLVPKVMLRYLMISCRDSLFFGMKKAGVNPDLANACSMAIYASFAQFRELTVDLMQGEGWSEPEPSHHRAVIV